MTLTRNRIEPLGEFVLVERDEPDEKQGVIQLSTKEKKMSGKVLKIGPGRRCEKTGKNIPIEGLEVGDTILIKHHADHLEFNDENGKKLVFLREDWVVAVVAA